MLKYKSLSYIFRIIIRHIPSYYHSSPPPVYW